VPRLDLDQFVDSVQTVGVMADQVSIHWNIPVLSRSDGARPGGVELHSAVNFDNIADYSTAGNDETNDLDLDPRHNYCRDHDRARAHCACKGFAPRFRAKSGFASAAENHNPTGVPDRSDSGG
jgi:hypothetical protein